MLDKLRHHANTATAHTDDAEEHRAFVELLVAAIFADHRVSVKELEAIESFDAAHPDWDPSTVSMGQYFGEAAAKVRAAQSGGTISALVSDIGGRLHTPDLREAALKTCADLLASDGTTDDEREFLSVVAAALR